LNASRRVLGDEHPSTLISISNLAMFLEGRQEYDQAEALYLECINGCRRVLGNDHPDTISTIYSLGDMYRTQGDMVKAQPLLDEYKKLKEKA
jgi:hypothetical protein